MTDRKEYYAEWYAANKEKRAASRKAWELANVARRRETDAKRRAENPEYFKAKSREKYQRNKESIKRRQREYDARNKDKRAVYVAQYNALIKRAAPTWLTPLHRATIKKLKADASLFTAVSGVKFSTDHIVPLNSPRVCGLHVPWNIQILTLSDNASKSNTTWPDMWE